jgi:hypothetical protein
VQSLSVRVTAGDGIGAVGIPVAFSVQSGAGTVNAASVTTDASGLASVTYTAGTAPETATIRATATGLAGSPLTFTMNVVAGNASQLFFTTQPASGAAGAVFSPAIVVQARDTFGNVATGYTGTVTLTIDSPPAGQTMAGTSSVAAVAGVATFSAARVSASGTGLRIRASGTGVGGTVLSNSFDMLAAVATQLVITSQPSIVSLGQTMTVVAEARTATGVPAIEYTGVGQVTILSGPIGSTFLTGSQQAAFINGVATFGFSMNMEGQYELLLTAPSLPQKIVGPFTVGTAQITIVSGNGQNGPTGQALPLPLVVRVALQGGPVAGITLYWSVTAGGGTLNNAGTTVTDASGQSTAIWIIGANFQSLDVQVGVGGPLVTFTASGAFLNEDATIASALAASLHSATRHTRR